MSEPSTPAPNPRQGLRTSAWLAILALLVAIAAVGVLLLLDNIHTRKKEAGVYVFEVVKLDETTVDPELWGKNYPRQHDSYLRTVDTERTRHGGSEAFQKLDEELRWRILFDGYAFGIDYREERGHAYMLSDQRETERVIKVKQPGACLHCHASTTVAYRQVGIEAGAAGALDLPFNDPRTRQQLMKGFEEVCAMPYEQATKLVQHPVSCLDCHDPKTNQLRVTRPGFLNGIQVLAASADPLPHLPSIERWRKGDRKTPYDPNRMATRQEMRSMACAQCHVEYYFKGEGKLLTYPWHNGLKVEQAEKYYDDVGFKDWTHKISGAPMLKAQHPEFELWSQGTHAKAGIACADCHMPYMRQGAIKVSDHPVRSPLLNINRACQSCHRTSEDELLKRAEAIQDRTRDLMDKAELAVLDLIRGIQRAQQGGATDEQLKGPRHAHRQAQWRLDYIAAENSMGFHAPQESARILGEAIDHARKGLMLLAGQKPWEPGPQGGEPVAAR